MFLPEGSCLFPPFLSITGGLLGTFHGILKVPVCKVPVCELLNYSATIARLSPPSGLERWQLRTLTTVFGCEIGRDRGLPIALPITDGVRLAVEGVQQR